jgi:cyclic pyranopterin phosphate synthase
MPFVTQRGGLIHGQKLEYNLVDHCNLSCRECSHLSPYLKKNALPFDVFVRDITRLATVYRALRFRFVGGEPLLNKGILDFIRAVRDSRIAPKIEIATNGVLLQRMPPALFEAVDSISVSLYPSAPIPEEEMAELQKRCRQHDVVLKVDHIDRFRRMQVRQPTADAGLVRGIFDSCLIAHTWGCQTFYDGHFYLCSRPIYTDAFLEKLGQPSQELRQRDGIPLHEPDLGKRLLTYLNSRKPLEACRHCLGTVGRYESHEQLTADQRKFPAQHQPPASSGIDLSRLRDLTRWHRMRDGVLHTFPSGKLARVLNALGTAAVGD